MLKFLPFIFFSFWLIFPLLGFSNAYALEGTECDDIEVYGMTIPCGGGAEFSGWFLMQSLKVAGTAAIFMVTYGGYLIMRSQGDPDRIQQGRELVTNALIGLAFITFSAVILRFIANQLLDIPTGGIV